MNVPDATFFSLPKTPAARVAYFLALLVLSTAAAVAAETAIPLSQAQFGGQCAEGLATGRHVMTDCSVTWKDKDGKLYCFKNEAAKTEFLKDTPGNLERARTFIAASNIESTETAMQYFDSNDAETIVKSHVEEKLKANGGVYPLEDALTGEKLQLAFDGVDFTRTILAGGCCT